MSDLQRIVKVNISRETRGVSQKGFGIGLILAEESEKPATLGVARTGVYGSFDEVAEAYASDSKVYAAALDYFAADTSPEQLIVGFIEGAESIADALTAITDENGDWYAVFMIRKDVASQLDLAAYLSTQCRIGAVRTSDAESFSPIETGNRVEKVFVSDNANFDLDADAVKFELAGALNYFWFSVTDGVETQADPGGAGTGNGVNILAADTQEGILTKLKAAIDAVADANVDSVTVDGNCLLVTYTDGAKSPSGIVTTGLELDVQSQGGTPGAAPNDIGGQLMLLSRNRTAVIYNSSAATKYIGGAMWGRMLPETPGAATYHLKELPGQLPDSLTDGQISILGDKNVNFYHTYGGRNVLENGIMAGGEFIDIIIGSDFIQARMQEAIYGTLVNSKKIPFTNAGLDLIVAEMEAVLLRAERLGILADGSSAVTRPDVRDIPFNDRAARCVTGIEFTGIFAGAAHKICIQGTVTV